jgi:uncharacterized protein YecT (DUF1311 family)
MISLVLAPLLLAQAGADALDCDNAMTQAAMNMCSKREFDRADEALNAVWNDVRTLAKREDAAYDYDDGQPGYWETLLKAQRAWLIYRDEHCRLSSYDARGGSLQPLLVNNCMTSLTETRTRELRALLENQVSGEPKSVSEE